MGEGRLGDPSLMPGDGLRRPDLGGARGLPLGDRCRFGTVARDARRDSCDGAVPRAVAPASSEWPQPGLLTWQVRWSSRSSSFGRLAERYRSRSGVVCRLPSCLRSYPRHADGRSARWIGPDLAGALAGSVVASRCLSRRPCSRSTRRPDRRGDARGPRSPWLRGCTCAKLTVAFRALSDRLPATPPDIHTRLRSRLG